MDWFVRIKSVDYGPYSGSMLKKLAVDGFIFPWSEVWSDSRTKGEAVSAERINELRAIFESQPKPVSSTVRPVPSTVSIELNTQTVPVAVSCVALLILLLVPVMPWLSLGPMSQTLLGYDFGFLTIVANAVCVSAIVGSFVYNRYWIQTRIAVQCWSMSYILAATYWIASILYRKATVVKPDEVNGLGGLASSIESMLVNAVQPGAGMYLALISGIVLWVALFFVRRPTGSES